MGILIIHKTLSFILVQSLKAWILVVALKRMNVLAANLHANMYGVFLEVEVEVH